MLSSPAEQSALRQTTDLESALRDEAGAAEVERALAAFAAPMAELLSALRAQLAPDVARP